MSIRGDVEEEQRMNAVKEAIKSSLDVFQEEIEKKLGTRTSWGRNDLKFVIAEAKLETVYKVL